jgi:iron complex transport system substrate-binding protein
MRIVSLVPAGTDILLALGLGPDVVGVSHECELPAGIAPLPRLTRSVVETRGLSSAEIDVAVASQLASGGPMYEIDAGALAALRPDLILTQALCGVCALPATAVEHVLGALSSRPAILSLDARGIDGMLDTIRDVGGRAGAGRKARVLVDELRSRIARVASTVASRPRVAVVCLEWLDPPYACGHWIPEMVHLAGGTELLGRAGVPAVAVPWADVERVRPRTVIAMPCGFDLAQAAREVERVAACTPWSRAVGDAEVHVAAGEYFTRPGPQLVTGIEALASVLHPGVMDAPGVRVIQPCAMKMAENVLTK